MVQAIFPMVLQSRRLAEDVARQYYASKAELDVAPFHPTREYVPEMLAEGIRMQLPDSTPTRKRVLVRNDLGKIIGVADKHVQDAARRQIMALVINEDDPIGWARIPTPPSCAYCIVTASRGPVYNSAEDAGLVNGNMDKFHNNCDCRVVPVFSLNSWDGRELTLEANRIYTAATKEHGPSINAVRRYLDGLDPAEEKAA